MCQEIWQKKCCRKTILGCFLRTACLPWKGALQAVPVYHEEGAPYTVLLTKVKRSRSEPWKIRLLETSWAHVGKHFGSIWKPLGNILGSIFEAFWEPFRHILGAWSALWRIYIQKGGGNLLRSSIFLNFWKKMKILGPEKGSQITPKMAPKKVGKEGTSKSTIFTVF